MGLLDLRELEGRTAILGGSFDPLHNGHLHIAHQILYWSRVAKILFVPNGNHHFKRGLVRLGYNDRYALVKSAIAFEPRFAISNADRSGSGYTADLIQDLMKEHPDTRYAFIIGSDNLQNLHQWYDYPWLVQNVHWLLLPRPGFKIDLNAISELKVSIIPIELCDISSTAVRHLIDTGQSIARLVPPELEAKIIALYKEHPQMRNHASEQ